MAALCVLAYVGYRLSQEDPTGPCSPSGFPGRCYRITETMCNVVWDKAEGKCKEWVKQFKLPPGRLITPVIRKCQLSDLDSAYKWLRISSPECDQMKVDLDGWRRSNM